MAKSARNSSFNLLTDKTLDVDIMFCWGPLYSVLIPCYRRTRGG